MELRRRPRQRQNGSGWIPWHHHRRAYAAIILEGGYCEIGTSGRFDARAGMMLVHNAFDAHANCYLPAGAQLVNLAVPSSMPSGAFLLHDPESLLRFGSLSPEELSSLLVSAHAVQPSESDWPDLLAQAIGKDPSLSLSLWAAENDLSPETISRGFRRMFGMAPRRFRAEVRLARAIGALLRGDGPLVSIAATYGFSDQAHMTRTVRRATGATPGQLALGAGQFLRATGPR